MHQINGQNAIDLALSTRLNGEVLAARAHVTYCPECAKALAELTHAVLQPEDHPVNAPIIWAWEETKKLALQFTDQIFAAFQPGFTLNPQMAGGLKLRQGGSERMCHYLIEETETAGYGVEIEVEHEPATDTCTLTVTVAQSPNYKSFKLTGAHVTILWDATHRLSEETDSFGEAVFEDIPWQALNTLALEIEPVAT
jgi:hypothetical protein